MSFFASKCQENRLWDFSGLAPQDNINDQYQREHFARQLASHLKLAPFTFQDWTDGFEYLNSHIKAKDIILLDEITWMGFKDPSFIPKLKAWWDKQTLPVMVIFCGSLSIWMEENILRSTAFRGRINLTITLEPLPIPDANKLLKASGFQGSDYDTYKLLSILGGIPWYLEQITPGQTVDDLIKQLCFEKDGLLVLEFDRIFHDLFNGKGSSYKKILDTLKEGMKTLEDIGNSIEFLHSGTLSTLMEHLIIAGVVQKQNLWSFKTSTKVGGQIDYLAQSIIKNLFVCAFKFKRRVLSENNNCRKTQTKIAGLRKEEKIMQNCMLEKQRMVAHDQEPASKIIEV